MLAGDSSFGIRYKNVLATMRKKLLLILIFALLVIISVFGVYKYNNDKKANSLWDRSDCTASGICPN
jgi:hypothetical protein